MLEKTLKSPLDARRSNQSILKKISPESSLEGLMLKLKLQYFDHLMLRGDSFEKTLMLGKIEARRRGRQRMRWLDGITDSWTWVWVDSGSWWRTGRPGVLSSIGSQRVGHNWATELNWSEPLWSSNLTSPLVIRTNHSSNTEWTVVVSFEWSHPPLENKKSMPKSQNHGDRSKHVSLSWELKAWSHHLLFSNSSAQLEVAN